MLVTETIEFFRNIQERLLSEKAKNLRLMATKTLTQSSRAVLLLGPRGVGKTNILLEKARSGKMLLYFSADHPRLKGFSLLEFSEAAFINGYEGILVDEVHYYKNWAQDLKALYDSHPDKIFWASDSSAGVLKDEGYDLSRRFLKIDIPLLSFREFIHLKSSLVLESFNPFESPPSIFASVLATKEINVMALYREYTSIGLRPIFFEGNYSERILAILDKTIHSDLPYLVDDVKNTHFMLMSAVIQALTMNPVPTINMDAMSKEWAVGREKLYRLLTAMEAIGLIYVVKRKTDHSTYSKGAKIFMADPSVYSVMGGNLGTRREALVYFNVKSACMTIFAAKDEKRADFEVNDFQIEVGGAKKKIKNADFVIRDDIDMPSKGIIPLWSLGMMV